MSSSEFTADANKTAELSGVNYAAWLPIVILCGGVVNGFIVRIMQSVRLNGTDTVFFGISPFELIALLIAAHLLITTARNSDHQPGWPDALALGLVLIPSSAIAWLAVTGYAGYLAAKSRSETRTGMLLFCALGITALWASIFIRWFAAPITAFEATIVTGLLSLLRPDVSVSANLMGVVGGHQVLLLPACASAYLIPKAILAFAAVTTYMGTSLDRHALIKIGVMTVFILTFANWVRLAVMTWSHDLYLLGHGPVGANIFDLFQTVVIIAIGMWASR